MADKEAPPSTASGADRISTLPDGVREHVLSFLPAHEAVRTTVLARSWRDLWRRSPALRITAWGSAAKFTDFVNQLLLLRCGSDGAEAAALAPLDSCHFLVESSDFDDEENMAIDMALVSSWIRRALRCQIQVLGVSMFYGGEEPLELCDMPLSKHLTRLELTYVHGIVGNGGFVIDFTGCPALVNLEMRYCQVLADEMWSPSLEHLRMTGCEFHHSERTLFCLPALISLELVSLLGKIPMVENISSLATATVRLDYSGCTDTCIRSIKYCSMHGSDDCGNVSCEGCCDYYRSGEDRNYGVILDGLLEVTDLEVSALPDVYVFSRDLKFCTTFRKLKTLVLTDWFVGDLSALIWFLRHSPILEKLTLKLSKALKRTVGAEGNYKLPEQSVSSDHLKIVEIKCEEVDRMVLIILKILNSSGIALEQINIQCSNSGSACVNFVCTGFGSK